MSLLDLLTKGLTRPGVASEAGTKFYNSPADAAIGYANQEASQLQPDTQQPTSVQIPEVPEDGQPAQAQSGSGYSDQSSNAPAPVFIHPNFKQASTDQYGNQTVTPGLTKKGALMSILLGGARGAAIGSSQRNFGQGFEAAQENPIDMAMRRQALQRGGLENQMLGAQIGLLPWQRLATIAGLQKTQAETGKAQAEGQKASAEANAVPIETQLKQAQAEAANYKEDPNLGLIDLRTKQPVSPAASAPLTDDEAQVLGKNPGDRVPLKLKNTANEIVNRGIRSVQANGRSYLVKGFGPNAEKVDMGAANPVVLNQIQQGPYMNPIDQNGNVNPKLKPEVDAVGTYQVPLSTALTRVQPASRAGFLQALKQAYPDFDAKTYEAAQKTLNSATSGPLGDQLSAYNTAILHANMLKQAAKDLAQHDMRALNAMQNAFQAEFGSPAPLTFDALAQLYTGETTKAIAGGHITDTELGKTGATLGKNNSPDQINKVLDAYAGAMQSKKRVTQNRIQQAMKGNVAYELPGETSGGSPAAPDHSDIGFVPTGAGPR